MWIKVTSLNDVDVFINFDNVDLIIPTGEGCNILFNAWEKPLSVKTTFAELDRFLDVKSTEKYTECDIESVSDIVREINDLRIHILLSENIAIKCKRENGSQNEEYWKGKIAAFREIRGYIDTELKKKYTEEPKQ